jgi:hypothetical protein
MGLEKFAFDGRLLDLRKPERIKAQLRRDKFYKPGNLRVLSNWLFTRDFLVKMVKRGGNDFTLKGSSALSAYLDAYRVPSDIDVEVENMAWMEEIIYNIIADERDIEYKLKEEEPYCGSIRQKKVYASKDGMQGIIGIDIMRDPRHATQDGTLRSVLPGDGEEVNCSVPVPEKVVGDKLNRILQVASLYTDRCAQPKDFVDIYHLANAAGFDKKLAQDFLREKLQECDITLLDMTRNARDDLPMLVHPHLGNMWAKYAAKNVLAAGETVENVEEFTINLASEMEF